MKPFRKLLYLAILILIALLIKEIVFVDGFVLGSNQSEILLIFAIIAGVIFILFSASRLHSHDVVSMDYDISSSDKSFQKTANPISLASLIFIRLVAFVGVIVAMETLFKNDPSLNFFAPFLILILIPILLFYKTPLGDMLRDALKVIKEDKDPIEANQYKVDNTPHDPMHVYEEHNYDDVRTHDDQLRCPNCKSLSIVMDKSINPTKYGLMKLLNIGLMLAFDGDELPKDKYRCLDCNKVW